MLDEAKREALVAATVAFLAQVRATYLRTPGASPLKHWDVLQERVRMAGRTSSNVREWSTTLARVLRLPAPGSSLSVSLSALEDAVRAAGGDAPWLEMLDREYAYVLAELRLWCDQKRDAREAAQGGTT